MRRQLEIPHYRNAACLIGLENTKSELTYMMFKLHCSSASLWKSPAECGTKPGAIIPGPSRSKATLLPVKISQKSFSRPVLLVQSWWILIIMPSGQRQQLAHFIPSGISSAAPRHIQTHANAFKLCDSDTNTFILRLIFLWNAPLRLWRTCVFVYA